MKEIRQRKILLVLIGALLTAITIFSLVIAYLGGIRGMGLLGVCFFFVCGIVVVLAQLIPACILISTLIGGVISSFRNKEATIPAA